MSTICGWFDTLGGVTGLVQGLLGFQLVLVWVELTELFGGGRVGVLEVDAEAELALGPFQFVELQLLGVEAGDY